MGKKTSVILLVILAAISGIFYRLGGWSKGDTKWRDVGCSALWVIASLMIFLGKAIALHKLWPFIGALVIGFGLGWGAMSTYHKWVGRMLFHRPKDDVFLEDWIVTGFCYGLQVIVIPIALEHYWIQFAIRTLALTILVPAWVTFIKNDWASELGRGFLYISTMGIFLIGG